MDSMISQSVGAYVSTVDGSHIRVRVMDVSVEKDLLALGFSLDSKVSEFTVLVKDDKQKSELFERLRALDVAFANGRDWCPAEVFLHLSDKGLLKGSFKMISWTGPDDYRVTIEG